MQILIKVALGLVAIGVLAVGAVFYFTADMTKAADEFFAAAKSGDIDRAYSFVSEDFRSSTTKDELQQFLEKSSEGKLKETSWLFRSISGGLGELSGSFTTESGGAIPITLGMVKSGDGWKINSIQKPPSGIQEQSSSARVPSEEELVKLVVDSTDVFVESVAEKSMVRFNRHASNLWQKQYTAEKLNEVFGSFFPPHNDLTSLINMSPQFTAKPTINENGVLAIAGFYPTKPIRFNFQHEYIYEGLGWKLYGYSVNIE